MIEAENNRALLGLTAQIVSAHLIRNPIPTGDLPGLIRQVHAALATAAAPLAAEPEKTVPAAAPRRTIFPDYIICLEDGRKLKTLKRHLRSTYGLSPEDYREKWGLPADYPMVAPNYAARRSSLAKSLGLGRRVAAAEPVQEELLPPLPTQVPRFTIASGPPSTQANQSGPPAPRQPEPTLESVFGRFPHPGQEPEPAPPTPPAANGEPESAAKRPQRKPFSKQLARTMRP